MSDQEKPVIVKTRNISHSLSLYAQEKHLEVDECDFTLKKIETLVRDIAHRDFISIQKENLKNYLNKEKILDEHIEFAQLYTISIHAKKASKINLLHSVRNGAYTYQPKIIIGPKSTLPIKEFTQKEMLITLYKELNKIKLLHGFLINIFDDDMKQNLKTFIKYLYAKKFTKKLQITLFSGIEPIITRESKLIYWYKQKENENAVIEVDNNEILIEYKKPLFGKNGLDAYGKEISSLAMDNSSDLEVLIDEHSILIEEDESSKRYKSKYKGFVHFDNKVLSIDNKIKLTSISRNSNAVALEENNNIEIIVSQHDTNQDSVGEGVELISELIHIDGFVGAKSKLEAITLKIDGATHQDSLQIAKYATINRHKGKLRCHEAKIALLEGGEVTASKVEVEASLGGTIRAIDVVVGHVKSNLKIYASNSIKVKLMSGEDNILNINYKKIPIEMSKIEFIKKDIGNLQDDLEESKKNNLKEIPHIKHKIKQLQEDMDRIITSYKDATISIEKPLLGLNNIVFTINDENEIVFKTQAQTYEPFFLEIDEETITLQPVNKSITLS